MLFCKSYLDELLDRMLAEDRLLDESLDESSLLSLSSEYLLKYYFA